MSASLNCALSSTSVVEAGSDGEGMSMTPPTATVPVTGVPNGVDPVESFETVLPLDEPPEPAFVAFHAGHLSVFPIGRPSPFVSNFPVSVFPSALALKKKRPHGVPLIGPQSIPSGSSVKVGPPSYQ